VFRRAVDQIPVVDEPGVRKVRTIEHQPCIVVGRRAVLTNEDEERQQAHLVIARLQQRQYIGKRQLRMRACLLAQSRHAKPKELIALAVVTRAGLEEPLRRRGYLRIAQRHKICRDRGRCVSHCVPAARVVNSTNSR
jgi:hypothetical protein